MPHKIVIDKTNLIGNDNNTFVYRFPSSVQFPNHEIALASVAAAPIDTHAAVETRIVPAIVAACSTRLPTRCF